MEQSVSFNLKNNNIGKYPASVTNFLHTAMLMLQIGLQKNFHKTSITFSRGTHQTSV